MQFSPLCIKAYGDISYPEFYPQIDEKGHFIPEPGDNSATSAPFTNLQVKQDSVLLFESEHGLDGKLFITDTRIVLMCDDYDSAGMMWIGNPVIMAVAGIASAAAAKARTAGKVLTGHIRYEWIESIVPQSEKLLFDWSDETIVINYRDPYNTLCSLAISLKNTKGMAHKIEAEFKRRIEQRDRQDLHGQKQAAYQLPAVGSTQTTECIYCTQCGKKLKLTDAYCKYCGAKQ